MEGKKAGGAGSVVLATASYESDIKLWHAHTGVVARTFPHADSQVNALAVSPDRLLLAAASHQHIRLYDVGGALNTHCLSYDSLSKNVTAIGYNATGKWMYTAGEDAYARIWDFKSRSMHCARMLELRAPGTCAALHPNQAQLFCGDQAGVLHVWQIGGTSDHQLVPEMDASIQHVDVSSDGRLLAAITSRGSAFLWQLGGEEPFRPLHRLQAHAAYGLKIKFSPDCKSVLTTSADRSARLWSTEDCSLLATLQEPSMKWVWDAAFSADSQYVFTGSSDGAARLWSLKSASVKRAYQSHRKGITALAFRDTRLT